MADDKLPWWKDGDQIIKIIGELGKVAGILLALWWGHDAHVDSSIAKEKATQNAAHIDELKSQRPVYYGEKK